MEVKLFWLLCMIWLHIFDDYVLQGLLGTMKQKKWWEDNYPQDLYKNDYKIALFTHAFSWTFSIMIIPFIIGMLNENVTWLYYIIFIINWFIHAFIDDLKANKFKINLIIDQLTHIGQIITTWVILLAL